MGDDAVLGPHFEYCTDGRTNDAGQRPSPNTVGICTAALSSREADRLKAHLVSGNPSPFYGMWQRWRAWHEMIGRVSQGQSHSQKPG